MIQYYLTVVNGTGSGYKNEESTNGIGATIPTGYNFWYWSLDAGAGANITNTGAANTTVYIDFAATRVTAHFSIKTYTWGYAAGAGGSVTNSGSHTVNYNVSQSSVATASGGYHFVSWSDGNTNPTRVDVNRSGTFTASFAANTHTLDYSATAGGYVTGTTHQVVNDGAAGTTVKAVANTGYHFTTWTDGDLNPSRIDTTSSNFSVQAQFVLNSGTTYNVIYSSSYNGYISGDTNQTVASGGSTSEVQAIGNTGYHWSRWNDGYMTAYRYDINITKNYSFLAYFEADAGGGGTLYSLSITDGTGGGVYYSGTVVSIVANTPASGYKFDHWAGNTTGIANVNAASTTITTQGSNASIYVVWATATTYTFTYSATDGGYVDGVNPQVVAAGVNGTLVTATANPGYVFAGWSDAVSTAARTDNTAAADINVTANFTYIESGYICWI